MPSFEMAHKYASMEFIHYQILELENFYVNSDHLH